MEVDCRDEQIVQLERTFPGLAERYAIEGKIGEGTFSTVYKALDIKSGGDNTRGWDITKGPRVLGVNMRDGRLVKPRRVRIAVNEGELEVLEQFLPRYLAEGAHVVTQDAPEDDDETVHARVAPVAAVAQGAVVENGEGEGAAPAACGGTATGLIMEEETQRDASQAQETDAAAIENAVAAALDAQRPSKARFGLDDHEPLGALDTCHIKQPGDITPPALGVPLSLGSDDKENQQHTQLKATIENESEKEEKQEAVEKSNRYVAIKRIYVTSSPARIQNELQILKDLTGCPTVVPIITAMRHKDQVVAVMPYFPHTEFRDFYRHSTMAEIRLYMAQLFHALKFVHASNVIHRDVKPTNFLYNPALKRGVLVDFGLAEYHQQNEKRSCVCRQDGSNRYYHGQKQGGYRKEDSRSSRRANRAGTRGFRAPEVLFKCQSQTMKIDVWSAGVVLLTFLAKRYPFFNSNDDGEALLEIATIFGKSRMARCALLHGSVFETNIASITSEPIPLDKLIYYCHKTKKDPASARKKPAWTADDGLAIDLLRHCMNLDFRARYSADEALKHPFFTYYYNPDEKDADPELEPAYY
ncbi:hypothetical protein TRVA0_045S00716 [Trichomonascus vanleenenianus]|uniref:serine/threonine protein kinase CDC7 n=1 Tax=Trichomonascus vanleenenianus TaxID=2268995 RepID=UPI003ECB715E